jgi:hypothetical protein
MFICQNQKDFEQSNITTHLSNTTEPRKEQLRDSKIMCDLPFKNSVLSSLERASGTRAHLWINVTHIPAQAGGKSPNSLKG